MGARNKLTEEKLEEYLEHIYAGKSKSEAATRIGVSRQAMIYHIKHNPDFAQKLQDAQDSLVEMVEEKLLRLAFTGGSLAAMKYYLENRCPSRWKGIYSKDPPKDDSSSKEDKS
jgi:hypothetical protein